MLTRLAGLALAALLALLGTGRQRQSERRAGPAALSPRGEDFALRYGIQPGLPAL